MFEQRQISNGNLRSRSLLRVTSWVEKAATCGSLKLWAAANRRSIAWGDAVHRLNRKGSNLRQFGALSGSQSVFRIDWQEQIKVRQGQAERPSLDWSELEWRHLGFSSSRLQWGETWVREVKKTQGGGFFSSPTIYCSSFFTFAQLEQ